MKTLFAVLALIAVALPARAADPRAPFDVHTNLTYYSGEGADKYRHRLDLYVPKGKRDVPVMMFVHGGGFTVGIKEQYAFVGQVFASHGIATAVINYRLSPKTSYPGHVQDTARAFAWLRAHVAEYGGKADTIFISGHSAGAILVGMLGTDSVYLHDVGESFDHIAGVIPISGLYTVGWRSPMFQGPVPVDAEFARGVSAIRHVAGPHPPFLILYGDQDTASTRESSEQMATALKGAGNSAEVHEIANHAHMDMITGVMSPGDPGLRFMLDFLRVK